MRELRLLRNLFWRQLTVRTGGRALLSVGTLAFFALLTLPDGLPLLRAIPVLLELRSFVQSLQPWDIFVVIFIVGAGIDSIGRVTTAAIERYNFRTLLALAAGELSASADEGRGAAKLIKARLTGRRRLLEDIMRFYPALGTLVAISVSLVLVGLVRSGLVFAALAVAIVALMPWIVARMDRRREFIAARSPDQAAWTREERKTDREGFAASKLAGAAKNSLDVINRPVDRLIVAWPVIALGAVAVIGASIFTIVDLAGSSGRTVLLIVAIAVGARAASSTVATIEHIAYFASLLTHPIATEDSGEE